MLDFQFVGLERSIRVLARPECRGGIKGRWGAKKIGAQSVSLTAPSSRIWCGRRPLNGPESVAGWSWNPPGMDFARIVCETCLLPPCHLTALRTHLDPTFPFRPTYLSGPCASLPARYFFLLIGCVYVGFMLAVAGLRAADQRDTRAYSTLLFTVLFGDFTTTVLTDEDNLW
jgi:hypothetical protein